MSLKMKRKEGFELLPGRQSPTSLSQAKAHLLAHVLNRTPIDPDAVSSLKFCHDEMPSIVCRRLGLTAHSTYQTGLRRLRQLLKLPCVHDGLCDRPARCWSNGENNKPTPHRGELLPANRRGRLVLPCTELHCAKGLFHAVVQGVTAVHDVDALYDRLADCEDRLPVRFRRMLGLPTEATYASAVAALRKEVCHV